MRLVLQGIVTQDQEKLDQVYWHLTQKKATKANDFVQNAQKNVTNEVP